MKIYDFRTDISIPSADIYYTVYKITNIVNGKIYYGKHTTKNPHDNYLGSGKTMLKAIKKYGAKSFYKEVIFVFDNEREAYLTEHELVTLDLIESGNCYNIVCGGYGFSSESIAGEKHPFFGKDGSFKNHKHTSETKKKISISAMGHSVSSETRKKISNKRNGYKYTDEQRIKARKRTSGSGNGMFGKKHSEETRKKISEVLKNSEKHKLASKMLSKKMKGRKLPCEISMKISIALKGKPFTEEHKKNMKNFRWMSFENESKKVKIHEIDLYLSNGWIFGRKQNTKI